MVQATSLDAFDQIADTAPTLRERVHAAITLAGPEGLTDEEMQNTLNLNPSTQRPRRGELVALNKVKDSGRTRETASGRKAIVWVTR